jgi:3-methyl-2-oxobutanoate hydroxymethyltransferase
VLVVHDLLGMSTDYVPSFVKPYAGLAETIVEAVTRFRDEVRAGIFPGPGQTFK